MKVTDKRLDRELYESIAATTTLTEKDLRSYRPDDFEDPDHEYFEENVDYVVDKLSENETTRRAIVLADDWTQCMVGVHVLVRNRIHVLSWLRSSDIDDYRDDDIGFLYRFGREIRKKAGLNKRLVVHIFTSSLHAEVER